jgi:hypothetical protein
MGVAAVCSYSMQELDKWKWRIRWGGRMTTTRIHYTEAEIRRKHPEAVRVDGSRIVVELPDTEEERAAAMRLHGKMPK